MTTETMREIVPHVDITSGSEGVRLTAEMPGADPATIEVTVENDILSISAGRTEALKGHRYLRRESEHGEYRRTFTLSRDLARDGISAEYRDGVLSVHIPRAEHTVPRKIEIRTGNQVPQRS